MTNAIIPMPEIDLSVYSRNEKIIVLGIVIALFIATAIVCIGTLGRLK